MILGLVNRILGLLPSRYDGLHVDNSRRYSMLNPRFQRGGGNLPRHFYWGQQVFDLMKVGVPLDLDSRVLDAGCGDGRVMAAFARRENRFTGTLAAFDITKMTMERLNQQFNTDPRFRFVHADIFHSYYNKTGTIKADEYRYEYPDNSFDLIFFNSIFSHLRMRMIENSLGNAFRCLAANGGKVWATCHLIDDGYDRECVREHRVFDTAYDEGFTATPSNPEGLVAYEKELMFDRIGKIGFTVERFVPGYWRGDRHTLDQHEQDILVLVKP